MKRIIEADYMIPTKDLDNSQSIAWRTGGLKCILGILIREYGKQKVKEELYNIERVTYDKEFLKSIQERKNLKF